MGYRGFDWRVFVRTPQAILAVGLAWCVLRLLVQAVIGWEPVGPDDWTRLLQVRSWLDGQAFQDVTQYRMSPPEGFSMHWSRLVDLPIAALALVFGETIAMALVPLLWLLPALFALRAIMLRLGLSDLAIAFGLVIFPLMPLLPASFAPMRIDHHTPQAVLGLICAALLLSRSQRAAAVAGVCAAAWVLISLEGLPLIAVIAGLYGLRYAWTGERLLAPFLAALAFGSSALGFATRGPSMLAPLYCDELLPGHVTAFVAATVAAALVPLIPGQATPAKRFLALLLVPAFALPAAWLTLGPCLANPMQQLDPVLQTYWHGYITEGLPAWRQPVSVMLMTLWTILIVLAAAWTTRDTWLGAERAIQWRLYFLIALAAGAYSLLLMRAGVIAQLLAIPAAAILLAHYLPRARALASAVPRILATLAVFGLATPMAASALAKPLDSRFPAATMRPDVLALIERGECDYSRLVSLEPGLVLVPLDAGPEILGLTNHTIIAASYHRNQGPMRDVLLAFTGPPAEAQTVVQSYGADYVIACGSAADIALYRTAADGNFANVLLSDTPPEWLELDETFSAGSLRVYRVR
ncbi:hypothetical protein [Aurantiacibacter gangjinensis]|uniref:Uncharacterized protein n=1 Tax=Aurantiacibacter gangjinensis TaxID=502682 RepID=A0A0G9MLF5_9SPHN|nr:hypothetical protein [Aurantiacibacter gangjinensis]APE27375.1 hypothetical protein BMF35_a0546 [Aurantiacibacter gangjinensis]KLE31459.1 hypothetical protein AAW01_07700 [Aurantiacibacter gangjinensis]